MKKILLRKSRQSALALAFSLTLAANAETFESDGVYYSIRNDSTVYVTNPENGTYSGKFTLVPTVEYNDKVYTVDGNVNALTNSNITEFTLADGFQGRQRFLVSLRNDAQLERLNLKCGIQDKNGNMQNFNVGNFPGCVYVSVTKGENTSSVHIERFNVYGPDGKKLTPFLITEGSTREIIYPDENMTFHLGKDFCTLSGEHCTVLELSHYMIMFLYVEIDGKIVAIRTEPLPGQGSPTVNTGNLTVSAWGSGAIITPEQNPETLKGDVVIPSTVSVNGVDMPVTTISADAFKGCPITSLTLPSSIQKVVDATLGLKQSETLESVNLADFNPNIFVEFVDCPNLTKAILPESATSLNVRFSNCSSLSEVVLPPNLTAISSSSFYDCPSLSDIAIPSSVNAIGANAFYNCSLEKAVIPQNCRVDCPFTIKDAAITRSQKLYTVDVLENTADILKVRVNANFYDSSNNPLPLCAVPAYGTLRTPVIINAGADNIFVINKKYSYNDTEYTAESIYFSYDATKGQWMRGAETGSTVATQSFFVFEVPSTDAGVDSINATDEEKPVEYYNLQGIQVANPVNGIYIRRQGNKSTKVMIKH